MPPYTATGPSHKNCTKGLAEPPCLRQRTRLAGGSPAGPHGCGCSSVVEHDLAKVGVEGSNPFARSRSILRPHGLASPRATTRGDLRFGCVFARICLEIRDTMAKLSARDAAEGWPLLRRLWREEMRHYRLQLRDGSWLHPADCRHYQPLPCSDQAGVRFLCQPGLHRKQPSLCSQLRSWLASVTGGVVGPIHVIAIMVVLVTSLKGFSLLGQIILTNSVVSRIEAGSAGQAVQPSG
jgi:hypothetical protein